MALNYDEHTDEALVALLKTTDSGVFETLYHRHAESLYRYAYNILEDEDACSDAVQDVFIWLWDNRKQLTVTNLKAYLRAAIRYRLVRSIQTSRRRETILSEQPLAVDSYTDDAVELRELQALIDSLVARLPHRAREVFHLSRNEYLSNKDIAAKLNITEKTVENHLTIALKRLREGLGRFNFWSILL